MGKEIAIKKADVAIAPTVQQTGNTNLNVTNENGGIVNFNISYPQTTPGVSAEQLMAIQSFNKEYCQLIVTCEEDVFKGNIVTVPTSRTLSECLVPTEIYVRCSTLSEEGKAELMRFPAIICSKNTEMRGATDPNQWAMFAYIKLIRIDGNNIKNCLSASHVYPTAETVRQTECGLSRLEYGLRHYRS